MQRIELAHVLRASSAIANETSFILIGSQAILLLLDEPPADLLRSTEIDLYPSNGDDVRVLLQHKLVKLDTLVARIGLLDAAKNNLTHITQWTQRRALEATA